MADILQKQDTSLVWDGGAGLDLTLAGLANGAGRQGESHDFGALFPQYVRVELRMVFAVNPTAGNVVEVWWASSIDGTNFDGECTGSDAAFATATKRFRLHYVGALSASADTDPQRQSWLFALPARYGAPVIWNASGQALTATEADQVLTVTPLPGDVS